jgi:hypothetical protein
MMMMTDDKRRVICEMPGRGNRSKDKLASVRLCPPQNPHDLIRLEPGLPR